VSGTEISEDGIRQLKEALPKCQIDYRSR
jgi:hypothetical protein